LESGKPKFAIVGLAVRLPGGVKDYGSLVELLHAGQEAISDVPTHRWNIDDYYSSDPDEPGTMYTRRAGFLDDSPAAFDAGLFRYYAIRGKVY
jgi:acyl transferase domain-containing protein